MYAIMPGEDLLLIGEPYEKEIADYCGATPFTSKTRLDRYVRLMVKTIKTNIIEKYGKDLYDHKVKGHHLDILEGNGTWGGMKLDYTIAL